MDDNQSKLAAVLSRYDNRTDPYSAFDVQCSLDPVVAAARASGPVPFELEAENIAFAFDERRHSRLDTSDFFAPLFSQTRRDGTVVEFPSIDQITPEMMDYWSTRAEQAKHPVLRFRYAALVWEFSAKVRRGQRPVALARAMVDAAAEIARRQASPHQVDVTTKMERALGVAGSINDPPRVELIRTALIDYEEKTAQDALLGTWGRSFDVLLLEGNNKKFPIDERRREKLVTDMEGRLGRAAAGRDGRKPDPREVESAALRLANYYRKRDQQDDVRRVLAAYTGAYLQMAEEASGLLAAGWLQQVHETLESFGLRDEAEAVAVHYRRHAERSTGEMQAISHSFSVTTAELEEFLANWNQGELSDALGLLAGHFIPKRAEAEQEVRKLAAAAPLSHMIGTTLLDHEGRAVGHVPPVDQDIEGHVILHIDRMMAITSVFLRHVVERLVTARGLDAGRVLEFIGDSPVFAAEQRPILEAGLRAYFSRDWLVSIHLLIPQIENAIRQIVRLQGGSGIKQGRDGSMLLKTLDELLRDERVARALNDDAAGYFRILLTDQRGWNMRNNVCHGLVPAGHFQPGGADRIFHVLVCLACLKFHPRQQGERGSGEGFDQPATWS